MMKKIKTEDAVGMILFHDITKIVPGGFKGRAFKKGHLIKEEDVQELLSLGKDHIYVWEDIEGFLHENDAAIRLKNLACGEGIVFGEIKEGKIDFISEHDGLLKIDSEELLNLNMIDEIMMATLHDNTYVKKGEKLGGTRVIPLVIDEKKIIEAEDKIKNKIVKVVKVNPKKVGIVTTGNEVFHGRIKDAFGPVIREKAAEYGCEVLGQKILPDDLDKIKSAILDFINEGAELIMCTGGMSVDPDDLTPSAIKATGAEIITYGSPVLPGAMFLLAYNGDIPIMGLPGCVMHSKRTVLDLVLPRVLAGERITKRDIAMYGQGGLCLNCEVCTFPHCSFGKY